MAIEFIRWLSASTGSTHLLTAQLEPFLGSTLLHSLDLMMKGYLSSIFPPFTVFNLLILINILLLVVFLTSFLNRIEKNSILSIIFAAFMVIQPYFVYRVLSGTSDLLYIFVFPLILHLLFKKLPYFYLALASLFVFFLNSYYGIYVVGLVVLYGFADMILSRFSKVAIGYYLSYLLVFIFLFLLFFQSIIISNSFLSGYFENENFTNSQVVFRSIEDYYNFSFRPWYFFIPPERSIYFGEFADRALKYFANTGYYLADDYAAEEMAGSYMGWHFLLGGFITVSVLIIKKFWRRKYPIFSEVYKNEKLIWKLILISILIISISLPPSFVIKGVEIYTPSYLLYYIAPVFRVLTRWAIVLFLNLLIINYILFVSVYKNISSKLVKVLLIIALILVNYIIFAIRIPVIDLNNPPDEIAFLDGLPEETRFAVYPYGDFYSIFWILKHRLVLLNPVGVGGKVEDFDPRDFSDKIVTSEGMEELIKMNNEVLVLYMNKVSDDDINEISKLNSQITDRESLKRFFENSFGQLQYDVENTLIFVRSDKL